MTWFHLPQWDIFCLILLENTTKMKRVFIRRTYKAHIPKQIWNLNYGHCIGLSEAKSYRSATEKL